MKQPAILGEGSIGAACVPPYGGIPSRATEAVTLNLKHRHKTTGRNCELEPAQEINYFKDSGGYIYTHRGYTKNRKTVMCDSDSSIEDFVYKFKQHLRYILINSYVL